MTDTVEISTNNLDAAIDEQKRRGYRLDMIFPADAPGEALMSMGDEKVRLSMQKPAPKQGRNTDVEGYALAYARASATDEWITGRAGMEYRDLLPGRLGGKVIASQIRLVNGGEVPDYVHYHKVDFQMIYCKRGRIKVVYEDQGPPFWLETGDCVLQPPEIRHRVLECTAGAEVIEIGMPAVHETWVEHDFDLPTSLVRPDRDFGGQRFLRHVAGEAEWKPSEIEGMEERDIGIAAATSGAADVRVLRPTIRESTAKNAIGRINELFSFVFPMDGEETLAVRLHIVN